MQKSPAILLRRTKLTDTSLIVTWCTQSHGIIKTVAKGALRPKSPFAGRLDLFFSAEIIWIQSRKSDLHTLGDAHLIDPRLGIRRSYVQTLAAGYFCDCLSQAAETDTPINDLYDLLHRALDFLASQDATAKAIHHFERQLAIALGIAETYPDTIPAASHQRIYRALGDHLPRIPKQRIELDRALNLHENSVRS